MKTLIPYIIIPGKCEQALNFYKECFDGEIIFLQKYSDTNYNVSTEFKNKIAHAEFKSDGIQFYLSDGFEGQKINMGDNIALSINFSDKKEQNSAFINLKVGGQVTMDSSETSINSTLATLIDKYGIHWYLNYQNVD